MPYVYCLSQIAQHTHRNGAKLSSPSINYDSVINETDSHTWMTGVNQTPSLRYAMVTVVTVRFPVTYHVQNVVSKGCRNKSMGYPMVKPHDPIVMSFDSVLKFQGTKVLHIEFSLHEAKSLELKVGVPTPCVVRGAPTRITWFRSVR